QIQPGGVPGVAFDQAPAAGARQLDMEIVVKFKDDGKVKDIIDAFWRDEASAREKFEAFKARRPEFANLRLDRVTYSNELVLVHENGATPEQRLQAMRAIAARLKAADDISYAVFCLNKTSQYTRSRNNPPTQSVAPHVNIR